MQRAHCNCSFSRGSGKLGCRPGFPERPLLVRSLAGFALLLPLFVTVASAAAAPSASPFALLLSSRLTALALRMLFRLRLPQVGIDGRGIARRARVLLPLLLSFVGTPIFLLLRALLLLVARLLGPLTATIALAVRLLALASLMPAMLLAIASPVPTPASAATLSMLGAVAARHITLRD